LKTTIPVQPLILIACLAVGRLTLSILVYRNPAPAYFPDSADYERLGVGLLEMTSYRWEAIDETELFRPPGYPAFIALVYGALGKYAGNLALVQLGLGGVIALLLFDTMRRLHSARAGLIAAALYLADPFSAVWALPVLSDTLFAALMAVGLYSLIRWRQGERGYWLALAGISGGIGSLVRPLGVLLLPLWAIFTLLGSIRIPLSVRRQISRGSLKSSALFGTAFLGIVIPWSFRNELLWDTFGVSSVAQYNLEYYLAPAAIAERDRVSLEEARFRLDPPAELSGLARSTWYLKVIWENPLPYLKSHLRGVVHTAAGIEYVRWFAFLGEPAERLELLTELRSGGLLQGVAFLARASGEEPQVVTAFVLSLAFQLLLYISGFIGFRRLYGRSRWMALLVVATSLVFIVLPGPVGESRFRLPVQPMLAMFGAWAGDADEDL